jgi:hypothetical protein
VFRQKMDVANENQHWISQHLLKRFKDDGAPLQSYQVKTGEWVPKSLERACAAPGYNQLLVSGDADNTLEAAFSKIESGLPNTLSALEDAVKRSQTEFPQAVYGFVIGRIAAQKTRLQGDAVPFGPHPLNAGIG